MLFIKFNTDKKTLQTAAYILTRKDTIAEKNSSSIRNERLDTAVDLHLAFLLARYIPVHNSVKKLYKLFVKSLDKDNWELILNYGWHEYYNPDYHNFNLPVNDLPNIALGLQEDFPQWLYNSYKRQIKKQDKKQYIFSRKKQIVSTFEKPDLTYNKQSLIDYAIFAFSRDASFMDKFIETSKINLYTNKIILKKTSANILAEKYIRFTLFKADEFPIFAYKHLKYVFKSVFEKLKGPYKIRYNINNNPEAVNKFGYFIVLNNVIELEVLTETYNKLTKKKIKLFSNALIKILIKNCEDIIKITKDNEIITELKQIKRFWNKQLK